MTNGFRSLAALAALRWLLPVVMATLFAGCGSREIRVYRVAKSPEESKPTPPTASSPHSAEHVHQTPIRWQLPRGWEQLPAGEMRLGDFRVQGANGERAEVMITPLAGRAGSDLANVNRWRGQVGLAPLAEDQLAANSETVQVGNEAAQLFEIAGISGDDEKTRILAVIFRRGQTSWFFKMIGPDALVQKEKSGFIAFLGTISFHDVAAN
jgi:hypothetical protein